MAQSLTAVNVVTLFVEDEQRSQEVCGACLRSPRSTRAIGTVILAFENLFVRLLARAARPRTSRWAATPRRFRSRCELSSWRSSWTTPVRFCAELRRPSIHFVYGPIDRPWGVRNAAFRDPDGHSAFSSDIPEG